MKVEVAINGAKLPNLASLPRRRDFPIYRSIDTFGQNTPIIRHRWSVNCKFRLRIRFPRQPMNSASLLRSTTRTCAEENRTKAIIVRTEDGRTNEAASVMPVTVTKEADSEDDATAVAAAMMMMDEESDKSDSVDNSSDSYDEDDDSSEMDEAECDRRRSECLDDIADLERQFTLLKEQLYKERITQVTAKLDEVRVGKAPEYLQPLEDLQENMRIRSEVSGVLRELRVTNIHTKYEAERLAAFQNYENEKIILRDNIESDLLDKIRRLEEDRNSIDVTSDLFNEQANHKKNRLKNDPMNPDKRKKPVTVTGPYIVYMLREEDILEDWAIIKKALKATKRKSEYHF